MVSHEGPFGQPQCTELLLMDLMTVGDRPCLMGWSMIFFHFLVSLYRRPKSLFRYRLPPLRRLRQRLQIESRLTRWEKEQPGLEATLCSSQGEPGGGYCL